MSRSRRSAVCVFVCAAVLAGCSRDAAPPVVETIEPGALLLSVRGEGELKSAKATPLVVPGENWAARQLVWMLPEGSQVKKGDLLARFTAAEGQLQLAQVMVDLQRNALSRAAKQDELVAGQGRVGVDLSKVEMDLGIAQRYATADLSTLARNTVLDAVQDVHYLGAKRDMLQWKRGQSSVRGGAELAVLDAQRATFEVNEKNRQADLDALELRAPNDGVLMLSADWSGQKPAIGSNVNAGFDFGSLPDAAAMEVELALPQIEAQGVRVGDVVELHPAGRPEQKITSTLSWVASGAKVRSRENPVKYLSMKAPIPVDAIRRYALVPGQRLQARIILLRASHALSVANVAVRSDDGKTFVQVRDGGGFDRREVKLGVRGTARSQVVAGLVAGDDVQLTADDAAAGSADTSDGQPRTAARSSADTGQTAAGHP
ncbi:MAG TPA: hypothetical protein VHL61_03780 [Luteimonas sp.]|jgi:hypothetical protein|nr:hypothetical protein [Luteimonas sp.]